MELSSRGRLMPASPIRRLVPLADEAKARGLKVFHLNIGQPDIPTPPEMLEAMRRFEGPVLEYGPSGGLLETRVAMAGYLRGLGWPIEPKHVLVTEGGSEAILFALTALCDPGDEVVVFEPFYTNYSGFACMAGVTLVPVETKVEEGYHLPSRDVIESAIGPRTRAILYSSPGNPTGTVFTRDEVRTLVDLAAKHDLFVIADEAYREFAYDGLTATGVLDVAAEAGCLDLAILIDSISKRFSACGARIGFLVTRNELVLDSCLRFGQARLCPPTLEQYAAVAGYQQIARYVPPMIEEYRRRRDTVMAGLRRIPGAVCAVPEGAFYAQPRLPVGDADAFARWLLTGFSSGGKTVMVAPGNGFYATAGKGAEEIRIAYVLNEENLRVAMNLLVQAVETWNTNR
jgi:aspartate aminotransferase